MKTIKIFLLLAIMIALVQANPRHRRHPHRQSHYYPSWHYNYHRPYYNHWSAYRYYTPVYVTTETTTVYPDNLVTITAEDAAQDVKAVQSLLKSDLISEREYEKVRKTLVGRIGMSLNPQSNEMSTVEIVNQIKTLHDMLTDELITEKEYRVQKKKLLALI